MSARPDRRRIDPVKPQGWRPPGWTAGMRGFVADPPPLERWEKLLDAERSWIHQAVALLARSSILRRMLRLSTRLGEPAGTSVVERERRVAEVGQTWLARQLTRVFGGAAEHVPLPPPGRGNRPRPGPLVDREIDTALSFLKNMPFEELQERGSQLHPNHFHWPLNDLRFLRENPALWSRRKLPAEIDWDLAGQEKLLAQVRSHATELDDVAAEPEDSPGEFVWRGGPFSGWDASCYYGLVRGLRPRRIVEVGIGWSTLVLRRALDANGESNEVTLIEPYPNRALIGELRPGWRIVEEHVQKTDIATFETLEAGDILFYDGSHCVRTGSDVNWMLFEVMPRLAEGVWVHFHDIFWPGDYPAPWILHEGLTWNEQYCLQAFLMHNDAWRVRLALPVLWWERRELLADWRDPRWSYTGASVWLERVA